MSSVQAERLEALLESKSTADRASIRPVLSRLAAEIKERTTRGSSASFDYFANALRILSKIRGDIDADLRMACLADCVKYFYTASHNEKALESASQLLALSVLLGDENWIRRGHSFLATIQADMGNVGEALVHHARALDLSRRIGNVEFQATDLINIGVALNYAGLYREAVPCLRQSQDLVSLLRSDPNQLGAKALANLAQSYLYLESYRDGLDAATQALAATPEPIDAGTTVSYVVRSLTFVQLALELGKLSASRQRANACVQYSMRVDSPRARTLAETARGLCEVHGGKPARGLLILEDALRNTTLPSCKPLILIALVKAYDVVNQPEQALRHMKELLEHIKSVRERVLAATLGSGRGDTSNLQALEVREARLEARIAERELVVERQEMLERLAVTADVKEEQSGEHGYRVGKLARLLAIAVGWNPENSESLEFAARLHDIGKIAMPDRILFSTKELQDAERQFVSNHTTIGAELLGRGNTQQLRMAEEIARHHHEWWNGEGYPSKLKGKRIPIHARIVALADVFDALTHGRPFSPPWPIDKALDEITARKGTQFDPEITDAFLELIAKLRQEHTDLDEYLGRAGRSSPFLQARSRIRQMLAEERDHEKMATVEGNETRH